MKSFGSTKAATPTRPSNPATSANTPIIGAPPVFSIIWTPKEPIVPISSLTARHLRITCSLWNKCDKPWVQGLCHEILQAKPHHLSRHHRHHYPAGTLALRLRVRPGRIGIQHDLVHLQRIQVRHRGTFHRSERPDGPASDRGCGEIFSS